MRPRSVFVIVALLVVATSLLTGIQHDYRPYTDQWAATMSGAGPWAEEVAGKAIPTNAYGPLHQVLAPLTRLHPLAPKLLFALLALAIYAVMLRRGHGEGPWRLAILFPLHPAVVVAVVIFGNNDILPAAALVAGCMAMSRGAGTGAGGLIALGALAKFYPLLFAGFLAPGKDGRPDLRPILAALAVFALGMGAAYLIWGPAIFSPFRFGQERGAKMLSVLRYLQGTMPDSEVTGHLLDRNTLYVLGAAVLVGLHGWLARLGWQMALLIGILAVFATYKVGHPQFYVAWLAVQAWILADPEPTAGRRVAVAFLPVSVFLALFQLVYIGSRAFAPNYLGGDLEIVRLYCGPALAAVISWGLWRARRDVFRRWQRPDGIGI